MSIECEKTYVVVKGQRRNDHVHPGNSQTPITDLPRQRNSTVPIRLGAGTIGNHGKMPPKPPPLLPTRSAEHLQAHRTAPLRLIRVEKSFQGKFNVETPVATEGLDPN